MFILRRFGLNIFKVIAVFAMQMFKNDVGNYC